MHLTHLSGRTRPTPWIIIDDFGAEHDLLDGVADFGGDRDAAYRNQWPHKDSRREDPDFFRAYYTRPRSFFVRESTAFASPFGISIELDIRIDFKLHPFLDEEAGEPRWTRAEGAIIEILTARAGSYDVHPTSTVLVNAALEAFCWAYIDLDKAREIEDAKRDAEADHA